MARRVIETQFQLKDWHTTQAALKAYGEQGQQALDRVKSASKGASPALKAVDQASREAQDAMRGLAAHAGTTGSILGAVGPKGLAAAAAIGAVTLAVSKGLRAFAEDERAQLRFQAVLKATGDQAGVSAAQIAALGEKLERSTLFKKEDILQASAVLASFGAASERTVRIAADMAEVFGGDVAGQARLLGKALEDPVEGMTALQRAGLKLSSALKETVQQLEAAGKHGQAVDLVLGELEKRVGGTAEGAAGGLAGATSHLAVAFGDLVKGIGKAVDQGGALTGFLSDVAGLIDGINDRIHRLNNFTSRDVVLEQRDRAARFLDITRRLGPEGFKSRADFDQVMSDQLTELGYWNRRLDQLGNQGVNYGVSFGPGIPGRTAEQERNAQRAAEAAVKAAEDGQRRLQQVLERAQDTARRREEQEAREERLRRAAEEQARIAERFAARVTGGFEDAFYNMFTRTKGGFDSLWDSARDGFFRLLAQMAAQAIAAPIIVPVVGAAGSMLGIPGAGAYVPGAGGAGGIGNIASGASSAYSLLSGGLTQPFRFLQQGAYSAANYLGLGSGARELLFGAVNNFTPLAGIAGLGGSMLASLLGLGGKYSSYTGAAGGIIGTALGGPLGALAGSFLGSVLGGFGGKKHPGASFEGSLGAGGNIGVYSLLSKHMGTEGASAAAQQLSGFLSGLSQMGLAFRPGQVQGVFGPGSGELRYNGRGFGFNPADPGSVSEAMRQLALAAAQAGEASKDLVAALRRVSTQGKDAAAVLAEVGQRMALKEFAKSLALDPATSTLNPEEIYRRVRQQAGDTLDRARTGGASVQEIQGAFSAYLAASQSYYGKGTPGYAQDYRNVTGALDFLFKHAPHFAAGGDFGPGWMVVGEQGAELIRTRRSGSVVNASETKRLMGGAQLALEVRAMRKDFALVAQAISRLSGDLRQLV
jgi:hypothetical protein